MRTFPLARAHLRLDKARVRLVVRVIHDSCPSAGQVGRRQGLQPLDRGTPLPFSRQGGPHGPIPQ
eukprot:7532081-Pyramimonas_sp.AAC.1